ncbi:mitotic checkpoint serine/threonine-protein kinase BUB1 [Quercus lobata]|uniref:BUB1 N-terminal domain-containing protein n=1 Tax=Quercus lobata TaxID=97700 RepID=A0A7N2MDZ2_QUELO|nr:mitotic checkpoint serine/threonine-protein kinase BUB1 [Quercus lobata]
MAKANNDNNTDLFTSLISDIKSYSGNDPLLPWLRGIRKMKDSLPSQVLNEKLPRFLQKCAQTFDSDRRYKNDLRYLRVWLQLMDFVEDPKTLLRTMEVNQIGKKKSLFYQAYALYYEKIKKFEEAEKMYHLGVQNLAEPADELQKSYEQFLHRMERYKNKRIQRQEVRTSKRPLSASNIPPKGSKTELNKENCRGSWHDRASPETLPDAQFPKKIGPGTISKQQVTTQRETLCSDDTVVVKFVDTAIVGKSEAEDACHHGLVDPTINMKEAMNAINSMFREPIETTVGRRSHRSRPKEDGLNNGFQVFIDENLGNNQKEKGSSILQHSGTKTCSSQQEPFKIFVDDEGCSEIGERDESENLEQSDVQNLTEGSHGNAFVFPSPNDVSSEGSDDQNVQSSPQAKFREDTVVCRFVGSTISDEPEVENVCHHGLVEPTINLKEAMDDINNMFGKPIDFVRTKRSKKQDKVADSKRGFGGFSILPDDDLVQQEVQLKPKLSGTSKECDLFEPTVFTKEAMDDINKLFGMPLDF